MRARIHATIADRRGDVLHKLSTRLVHENPVIAVESLPVKHMIRNPRLSKSIADVGWGELVRQREYKAKGHSEPWSRSTSSIHPANDVLIAGTSCRRGRFVSGTGRVQRAESPTTET